MAAVTIDAAAKVAYYSAGNLGWSARSLFAYRTAIQQLAGAGSVTVGTTTSNNAQGQSFTPGASLLLSEVRIPLRKNGSPTDNVTLTIQSDASNKPSGTVLGTASRSRSGTPITTTSFWTTFKFTTPISLSASTKYWMVVQRSGAVDAANYYFIETNTASGYAGGGTSTLSVATWGAESATIDWYFQVIQQVPSALYAVTQDTSLHIWKSTNSGASWTEQDSANAPAVTNANFPFDATDTIAGPYIVTAYLTATNTAAVKLFNMSTDTWTSGTFGTGPPTTVSNERNIRASVRSNVVASAPGGITLNFTDSVDDADLFYKFVATSGAAWGTTTAILAIASSLEASMTSEVVDDEGNAWFTHRFYYDCFNFDYSMRSWSGVLQGTETDLSTTAADLETEHVSATYQPYSDGSGVTTVIAAFINATPTLRERILTLEATSASVTMATDNSVSALNGANIAGRQLSTARYNGTNYVAVGLAGTGISYYTSTVAGTWSTITSFVSGLTNCTLSRLLSIEDVGLAVIYTDNGDTKFDWIVAPVAGGGTRTATPVTIALQATSTRTATPATMALQAASTRTASPVTASLATVNSRTSTPVTAALIATLTRTASVTMALSGTLTRTGTPVTLAAQSTASRTATPVTAALLAVKTRTATPVTAALTAILTRTAPATIATQATLSRTASSTAALGLTSARTATPVTAALGLPGTRTATPITAALLATKTRTATVSAALQLIATRTAPASVALIATTSRSSTPVTLALSGAGNNRTATPITIALQSIGSRTATPITAALIATLTRIATAAMALQATRTASPITIALQTTSTRTAASTVALSGAAGGRTASPVTVALSGILTRSSTATIALQTTRSRTSTPVTAALAVVRTRTATPITTALLETRTRTSPATLAAQDIRSRIAPASVALQTSGARSITPVTIALSTVSTRSASATVAVHATTSRTATPVTMATRATRALTATPVTFALQTVTTRTAPATFAVDIITGPEGVLSATLTHRLALTGTLTHDLALDATTGRQRVLGGTLTSVRTLDGTLETAPVLAGRLEVLP